MNKTTIKQYMKEVWNKKNLTPIDNIFSATAIVHSPLGTFKSPSEMKETVSKWLTAFPDLEVTLVNTIEENDIVASHWKANGTHQKEFNGIQAKGNQVAYNGVSMYRFENGKVVEYWAYLDSWTLEHQMKGV